MRTVLPDCRDLGDPFYLTPDQRRELILLIAERGEDGIREFIRRHEHEDSTIGRKIQKIRGQLLEEGAELRRRLHDQYDEKRMAEHERARRLVERLRQEEEALAAREQGLTAQLPADIAARVRTLPIIELALAPAKRRAWPIRIWNWVRHALATFWHGVLRLLRLRRPSAPARAIAVGVPGLRGVGVEVELNLEDALRSNPDLRRRIRKGLGETWAVRTRRLWRILLGLDNYADVAQEIMQKEAERAAHDRYREVQEERHRLDDDRRKRKAEEARLNAEVEAEVARLDRTEALERDRLEQMLAEKPRRDVQEAVVGELEAAGLVQRLEERLVVTGRYLESLAALVYAEESRGIGPTAESPLGTSIEGEGLLERSPLLSHYEASHMDVVSTLVQARTRHPHVRHLLEEDVLVYRERRSALTHVVIILDKSLSMEENERMAAAKRAALALYWGTKRRSPLNRIDFLLMDTSVKRANLSDCWDAKPGGFTNTGRAIELARSLLVDSRATRKILFLVTDGLPEALTLEGKDVAGRPEEALAYAVRQTERLRDVKGLSFSVVLLEPQDPLFVKAGERLAAKGRGRVVKVTPQELTRSLLVELREEALVAAH